MSKASWAVTWIAKTGLLLMLLAACEGTTQPSPVPTQVLIPVTATATPQLVTPLPTPTEPVLLQPAELIPVVSPAATLTIPADAQPMAGMAIDDLARRLETAPEQIEVVRLESATWNSIDLGCGDTAIPPLANLAINGFRLVLGFEGAFYEYHTDRRGAIRLCSGEREPAGKTNALLLERDPVAAELVLLAQGQLARQLDLPTQRIVVKDVKPYTWTDNSLGCPLPGRDYVSITIPGYRLVLEAGDRDYIFHSDSEQLFPCEPGNERLPR